jgi:hypothetical protein
MTAGIDTNTDDLAIRFLLDELPEEERVQVENRLLADNEFFETVLSAESALVDQYVQGLLEGDKLKRAKTLFESSSLQRGEVRFTKELIVAVRESGPPENVEPVSSVIPEDYQTATRSQWFRLGWVVPVVLCLSLLAGIAYLYSSRRTLEDQRLAAERSADEARRKLEEQLHANNELSQQLQTATERRTRAEELIAQMQNRESLGVASIILAPATSERGGGPQIVSIRSRSERVRIQLELDDPGRFNRYSVTISTVAGRRVWKNDSLRPDRTRPGILTLLLAAKLFEYEDYKIELKGQALDNSFVYIDDYLFKVSNK